MREQDVYRQGKEWEGGLYLRKWWESESSQSSLKATDKLHTAPTISSALSLSDLNNLSHNLSPPTSLCHSLTYAQLSSALSVQIYMHAGGGWVPHRAAVELESVQRET